MTLEDMLKLPNESVRLSISNNVWLFYDDHTGEWVVMIHEYGKGPRESWRGEQLKTALVYLVNTVKSQASP